MCNWFSVDFRVPIKTDETMENFRYLRDSCIVVLSGAVSV